MSLLSWLRNSKRSHVGKPIRNQAAARKRATFRPRLEALEDRWMPSTLTVTNNLDSGAGSLRADIAAAKSGDTIVFAPSLDGKTITLTSGELFVTTGMTIQHPGASQLTVSGHFEVNSSQPVVLSGLTISNGGIANDSGSALTITGSTISNGPGIFNRGTLTVTGCTIAGNTRNDEYSGSSGGAGIDNYRGTLTVSNSTIAGNTTYGGYALGGGIYAGNGSTVTLTNCTISNNTVTSKNYLYGNGGGVYADGGSTVTLTNCTVANNVAGPYGGGLFVNGSTTYSNNKGATVYMTNCTVSGNLALFNGGGIYVNRSNSPSNVAGTLSLSNTIVAGNRVTNFLNSADIYNLGVLFADHNNLLGDVWGFFFRTTHDIVIYHANPLLGPLQDNGGPTQTMALLPGSPAIGHGNNSLAPATDERGFTRLDLAGETTDIGAFEL